jgi:hypothetical protein
MLGAWRRAEGWSFDQRAVSLDAENNLLKGEFGGRYKYKRTTPLNQRLNTKPNPSKRHRSSKANPYLLKARSEEGLRTKVPREEICQ